MKSYGRSQTFHYEAKRRSLKAALLKGKRSRRNPSVYPQFIKPQQKATAIGANIADLTQFLAKYLSGKQNVYVVPHGTGYAASYMLDRNRKPYFTVFVPKWDTYNLPVQGFDKYRIYRNGVWHEASHIRFTPSEMYTWIGRSPVERDMFNIIEDRRIEDLGVEEWPGYLPERLYANAYAYALRPPVDSIQDRDKRVYEAFLQKLIVGKIKGKLNPEEMEKVEKAVKYVEDRLEQLKKNPKGLEDALIESTRKAIELLELPISFIPPDTYGAENSWQASFTGEYAQYRNMEGEEVKAGMEEYFEDAEKRAKAKPSGKDNEKKELTEVTWEDVKAAREGSVEVKNEYQQAQKGKAQDPLTAQFTPVLTQGPAQNFRDNKFITDMNTHLRKWKTGYEVVIGKTGARLSIPDYIRRQEEPFATRLKRSARGKKMLVVADFSGSMKTQEEAYKKAIISALEVLSGIGSNIALFGFGHDPAQGDIFFKVKTFEEPRWTSSHAAKVAALQADYNSTPTYEVYARLTGYIKKHSPDVTVTITDGDPDKTVETSWQIEKLRRHTRMVAFGIGGDRLRAEHMASKLKNLGYHDSFAVADLKELPPKLVKLLTPT